MCSRGQKKTDLQWCPRLMLRLTGNMFATTFAVARLFPCQIAIDLLIFVRSRSHLSKTGKMMVLGLYDGGRPTNPGKAVGLAQLWPNYGCLNHFCFLIPPGDKGSEQGRAQRKTLRARLSALVPDNEDAFVFGSLDSREWHDFIQHRFGGGSTPRVVILDGDKVHFEVSRSSIFVDIVAMDQIRERLC